MFPSAKCQLCRKGDKVCSRLKGMTCGQCMRDQKGCSAVAPESECEQMFHVGRFSLHLNQRKELVGAQHG